jgi:HSP20 family protein
MGDIIKRDPFKSFLSRSWWDLDDFQTATQRGLKLHEDDKNIYVEAVIAGVAPENVNIEIEDGVLTIKAESIRKEEKKGEYSSSSYQYYYTCALSGGKWDKVDAEVKHGVVTITIPKAESAKLQRIKVRTTTK